ncbi:MAG: sugar transferase, partial [Clostridia bacterium]
SDGWLKHFDFLLSDIICSVIALQIAYMIKHGMEFAYAIPLYRNIAIVISFIQVVIVFFNSSYKNILKRGYWKELVSVIKYVLLLLALFLLYLFITGDMNNVSRITFAIYVGLVMALIYLERIALKKYLKNKGNIISDKRSMILVGDYKSVENLIKRFCKPQYDDFMINGAILTDNQDIEEINGIKVVSKYENGLDYIKSQWVDEVFVSLQKDKKYPKEFIDGCNVMGITVHIKLDNIIFADTPSCFVETVGGYKVITSSIAVAKRRDLFIKRSFDILSALIGLLATGILFLIFAPIIHIQSPGPIFFSQERVGKNGKIFKIYKFRSMYIDAEERKKELMSENKMDGYMFKIDNDPRIFPIGKLIRALSIDEFPQFLNVLKGDMSLIGTRPPTVDEYKQYQLHHKARLAATPGITGLWQVSGRSDITDFEEVVALDKEYIENWSISLDIKILFKTVVVVLTRKGSV